MTITTSNGTSSLKPMLFRLSAKLNTHLKHGRLTDCPMHTNPFADWSAHLFLVKREKLILVSNTPSLYSFIMYGHTIPFHQARMSALTARSASEGGVCSYVTPFTAPTRLQPEAVARVGQQMPQTIGNTKRILLQP